MPRQGQSVESCILTEIKKRKGDAVTVGEMLFAYETDKAAFEEEARVAGTVLEVFFAEGDEVPVLTGVMVIGDPEESAAPQSQVAVPSASPVSPRAKTLADRLGVDTGSLSGSGPDGRIIERDVKAASRATPLAREMMREGMLAPRTGSGLGGAVRSGDLVAGDAAVPSSASSSASLSANDSTIVPLSNMRRLIARAMHASLQNSAQLTHHLSADARRVMELRRQAKAAGQNITIGDMMCWSAVRALEKFPAVNAHFLGENEGVRRFAGVHLALAVDTERGLMVPVVRDADRMSIGQLSASLKEVAEACRRGSINPDLLAPGAASFTVSNLGNYGVEMFTPIINLPQVAILGVNTIVPRPEDLGDGVYGFVPHLGLSLTYDHRAIDGGEATRFLKQIAMEIENLMI
jgi:pyruvate dehydrogenase E2 component (dihydrolipoamide acetyltransferase)